MRLILRFDIQTIQVGDYNCLNFDDNTWSVRLRPGTDLFSDSEVTEKSIWFRVEVSNVCMLHDGDKSNSFQLTFYDIAMTKRQSLDEASHCFAFNMEILATDARSQGSLKDGLGQSSLTMLNLDYCLNSA